MTLEEARQKYEDAKNTLHTTALLELAHRGIGLWWVGEETEIYLATSPEAIRAAGLAAPDDEIGAVEIGSEMGADPEENPTRLDVVLKCLESSSMDLMHGPYQIWSAYN